MKSFKKSLALVVALLMTLPFLASCSAMPVEKEEKI